MTLIALNNYKKIVFKKDYMVFWGRDNQKNRRLIGDDYKKYVFPIRNELKSYNSIKNLYMTLKKTQKEINEERFVQLIEKMWSLGMLSIINKDDLCYNTPKVGINLKQKTITVVFNVPYLPIRIMKDKLSEMKCNIIVDDYFVCSKELNEILLGNVEYNLLTLDDWKNINNILNGSDLVIYIGKEIESEFAKKISKNCIERKISILYVTFFKGMAIIGPAKISRTAICQSCLTINETFKKITENYNSICNDINLNYFHVNIVMDIILKEIFFILNDKYSTVTNSILYVEEKTGFCINYKMLKFGECDNRCTNCLKDEEK